MRRPPLEYFQKYLTFQNICKEETRNMNRLRNSGLFKSGLPVVASLLAGILVLGAVSLGYAKPPALSSLGETELEWRQIVGIILPGNTVGSGTGKVTGGACRGTRHVAVRK